MFCLLQNYIVKRFNLCSLEIDIDSFHIKLSVTINKRLYFSLLTNKVSLKSVKFNECIFI